jgi:cytochrome P450
MLADEAENFEKGEIARRGLGPVLGDAILTADGSRWRWQRHAVASIFRQERIRNFLPAMVAAAERTRNRWLSYPPGGEIDVAREMMRTTFDIILNTLLSERGGIDCDLMQQSITNYLEPTSWIIALAMVRAPRWVPYPGRHKARRARGHLHHVLDLLIDEAKRNPSNRDDLLSLLTNATDPETDTSMNDLDVRYNLLTFITAGHETTAVALTWTFYLLSLHPEVEKRINHDKTEKLRLRNRPTASLMKGLLTDLSAAFAAEFQLLRSRWILCVMASKSGRTVMRASTGIILFGRPGTTIRRPALSPR